MIKVLDTDLLRAVKNGSKSTRSASKHGKDWPVLTGILIRQSNSRLEVISTDLETISRDVAPVAGDMPGIVIPQSNSCKGSSWTWSNPLSDWLKVMEPSKRKPAILELEVVTPSSAKGYGPGTRTYLTIKAGNITAKFFGFSPDEFPYVEKTLENQEPTVEREPIENVKA
jgi:hypothetical protein